ncbi:MAG: (d)CMP kinase [Propionibacteriaceae bacterium]|jgi:cytidylate kinase|nr:(d)CMP kinase [Propionibacteriaceae bacterium]
MFTIAIDGPSGSGKTTCSILTAQRLGCSYLDTGAMYRAVAVGCLEAGIDHDDQAGIVELCRDIDIDISTNPNERYIRLGDQDITQAIRTPAVSAWVSAVSTIAEARAILVDRQRAILASGSFVAEGRDITTVVAPDAEVRVLLIADPDVRMARRGAELSGQLTAAALRDQILRRDRDDSTLVNFTVAANGVVTIDSTLLTVEEVVDQIIILAQRAGIEV